VALRMGILKEAARIPWRLAAPIRRRLVFRFLHYGRQLLEPIAATLQQQQASLQESRDWQRSFESTTAASMATLADRLEASDATTRSHITHENGIVAVSLSGLTRDLDRFRVRAELLFGGSQLARPISMSVPPAIEVARFAAAKDVARFPASGQTMISYAQNREDVLLQRLFPRNHRGFYVDVGAGDPVEHSVTKHFYDTGWTGISIEPATHHFDRLVAERPDDVNLKVGAWDSEGELTLFETTEPSGLSTVVPEVAGAATHSEWRFRERKIPVTTLSKILEAYAPPVIDFLKVDVEGAERHVLAGNDWRRFRPRVVVVEATRPISSEQSHAEWENLILEEGYHFATFDGLNRYYIRKEDEHLVRRLHVPANVFDAFVPYEVVSLTLGLLQQLAAERAESELNRAG